MYKLKLGEVVTTIPTIGKLSVHALTPRVVAIWPVCLLFVWVLCFFECACDAFDVADTECRRAVTTWVGSTGFNVETVEYKNKSMTVWDVGGQDKVG